MSSKTFKSVFHGSSIQVHDNGEGVFIGLLREDSMTRGTTLSKSDAPALMQAIGECLPPIPDTVRDGSYEAFMAVALEYLGKAVRALEAETAEAKEQAELEAEALELRNAFSLAIGGASIDSFAGHSVNKPGWIDAARRAREMRNEKKVTTDD